MALARYGSGMGTFDLDPRDPRDHPDCVCLNGFMAGAPCSPQSRKEIEIAGQAGNDEKLNVIPKQAGNDEKLNVIPDQAGNDEKLNVIPDLIGDLNNKI